jgi:hypothetical protein
MTRTALTGGSGTQTADGSEDTLKDDTSNQGAAIDAYIDCRNMTSGDVTEIRVYVMLLSGGTLSEAYYRKVTYNDTLEANGGSPVFYVPAITEPYEYKLTLKQIAGTNRNYDYTIYKG